MAISDLLVRRRDIRRATELMIASGLPAAVPLRAIDAGKIPGQYLFSKPDSDCSSKLHKTYAPLFPRLASLERFSNGKSRAARFPRVPALSVEDELVLICVHGAKHLWGSGLMWIADVAALVSGNRTLMGTSRCSARGSAQNACLRRRTAAGRDLVEARMPDAVWQTQFR